ncbi:MAG: SpoIIE family protein phosphatase [Treponema sp.]|nr:SpoIIE family protein phosphatase [Treponema sp.]
MLGHVLVAVLLLAVFFVIVLYATIRARRRDSSRRKVPLGQAFSNAELSERAHPMEVRGLGMGSRLVMTTMMLMLLALYVVSIPMYRMMVDARKETLLKSLWGRSSVLLDVLSDTASFYLREGNVEGIYLIPLSMIAVPEACYITVTGAGAELGIWEDIVWASNDPDIFSKIDTGELLPGVSRLRDAIGPRLMRAGFDPRTWDGRIFSEPEFTFRYTPRGTEQYIFFKPIPCNEPFGNDILGFIKMGVCTGSIVEQARPYVGSIRRRVLFAALAAFAVSATGVFVHSAVAATRMRKLLNHARLVLSTDGERELSRMEILMDGQDEVAVLGNMFNSITQRLAKTAMMISGLSAGKKLQRKLLPLDRDKKGEMFDFSHKDTGTTIFFAYYEEAQEISGDYFDYRNLDDRYYAIIKCDVAGSGIPAALVTMQISTMFRSYFWSWDRSKLAKMPELVYMINGFIERMGASKRFAAFTFCIYDSETGEINFCNAGDNIVHVFDASQKRVKSIVLPESPAAGILGNDMIMSMGGGYKVHNLTLKHGDMLLLYTDGLEESRRKYRGPVFDGQTSTVGVNRVPHGNYIAGQWGEELGAKRIQGIIDAVANCSAYRLHKWHTPDGKEEFLHFDFSSCRGGVEEVIIALAAVEKMFRCYRSAALTKGDRVLVDREIDAFLRTHFLEYHSYLAYAEEYQGNGTHIYYANLKEDYRYDDLAVLGVERK